MLQPKGKTSQLTSNAEVPTRYGGPTASGGNVTAGMHLNVGYGDSAIPMKEAHLNEVADVKATEHRSSGTAFKVFFINASNETAITPKVNETSLEADAIDTFALAAEHREMQRKQIELILKTSKDCFNELSDSVNKANEALAAINHRRYQINNELMIVLEQLLVGKTAVMADWIFDGIEKLDGYHAEISTLIDNDNVKQQKINELMSHIETSNREPKVGLSEKFDLAFWDCETVRELSYKMGSLQKENHNLLTEVNIWKLAAKAATKEQVPKASVQHEVCKASVNYPPYPLDASFVDMRVTPKFNDANMIPKDEHHASYSDKSNVDKQLRPKWPMPTRFTGKTRGELERYFITFESSTARNGIYGDDKSELLAHYLPPDLQQHHYSIFMQTHDYEKVKSYLLNVLGSENSVAMFTARAGLDRLRKSFGQSYAEFLREVEDKVAEAFAGEKKSADVELKKILIRVTQNDRDMCYYNIILPQLAETYLTLKQLILSTEVTRKLTTMPRYSEYADANKRQIHPKFEGNNVNENTQNQPFQDGRKSSNYASGSGNNARFQDGRNSNNYASGNRSYGNAGDNRETPKTLIIKERKGQNVHVIRNYVIPPNKRYNVIVTAPIDDGAAKLGNVVRHIKFGRIGTFYDGYCSLSCTNTSDKELHLKSNQIVGKALHLQRKSSRKKHVKGDETSSTLRTAMAEGDVEDNSSWYKSLNVDADTLPVINNQIGIYREQPLTPSVKKHANESTLFNERLESLPTARKELNGTESNSGNVNQAKANFTGSKETTKSISAPWWDNFICIRNNDSLSIEKTSSATEATTPELKDAMEDASSNPQLKHAQEKSNSDVVKVLGIAEMDNYAHHQTSSTQIEASNALYVNENEWKQDTLKSNGIKSTMKEHNTVDHRSVNNRGYAQQHRETSRRNESQTNVRSSKQLYGLDDPIYYGNRRGRRARGGRGESYSR